MRDRGEGFRGRGSEQLTRGDSTSTVDPPPHFVVVLKLPFDPPFHLLVLLELPFTNFTRTSNDLLGRMDNLLEAENLKLHRDSRDGVVSDGRGLSAGNDGLRS
jgi:hypothetical protein